MKRKKTTSGKIKGLISLLFLVTSVLLAPSYSFARTSYGFPVNEYTVEFLDANGNDFPVRMTATAPSLIASYQATLNPWSTGYRNPDAVKWILRDGTNACFDVNSQGGALTRVASSSSSFSVMYLLTVTLQTQDPIPYVKYFSLDPPPGQELKDKLTLGSSYYGGTSWNAPNYSQWTVTDRVFQKDAPNQFSLPRTTSYHPNYPGVRIDERRLSNGSVYWRGRASDVLKYYAYYYQVVELYEDQAGNSIPAPPGYVDGKGTAITSDPFNYQMENGSSLPRSYTDATHAYSYEGWYRGDGNQASIDRTYPPAIEFQASMDDLNRVHIVYKKIPLDQVVELNEKFVDESDNQIDASWDQVSLAEKNTPISVTPTTPKTDTSGADWEYVGWKLDTDSPGTVNTTPINLPMAADTEIHYIYKKVQHTTTEKWVDVDDGTTLIDLAVNPKTSQLDSNETFTTTPAATINDQEGNEWEYVGWENVTDDSGNIRNEATATISNVKADKEIKYHYKRVATTADFELVPDKKIVNNGETISWSAQLTNTGATTLKNIVLKATGNYSSGLSTPGQLTVTPAGGSPQTFPVGGNWTTGIDLSGLTIPSGGTNNYADIEFTTTATGNANQVLMAELDVAGNLTNSIQANDVVRIDDVDQPNLKPTGDVGFINLPDFRFGYTRLETFNHDKGLEETLYQTGYNPYVRLMNNTAPDNWEVFVKLDQFASNTNTLPTTTSLTLKNGVLKEVQNYDHPFEALNTVGTIADQVIFSDSSSVQLVGALTQGVYQADYAFDDVQANLIGKSGLRDRYYTSTMHWSLVTGP